MGQGQDKIAISLLDLQPTAIVELFLLYFNTVDKENSYIAFHGGAIFDKGITWQGVEYLPMPVETDGFEINANGQMSRPKIKISNKDYFLTDLLSENQDLQFAKVIRKRTFVKYLDDVNFDGGNPWGQADSSAEISNDTFVVSQKTAENKIYVEFELSSPLDLENFEVNNRLMMARYCSWYYRGNGCNYAGPPLESEDGRKVTMNSSSVLNWKTLSNNALWETGIYYNSGDPVYLENKKILINPINSSDNTVSFAKIWYVSQTGHLSSYSDQPDLNQTYWLRDGCNKKIDGCKKRFQNNKKQQLGSATLAITNSYVDFSHKKQNYNSNNVASQASASAVSELSSEYKADNAIDGVTGYIPSEKNSTTITDASFSWASNNSSTPWIKLTWPEAKTINRVDLYDRPSASSNLTNAKLTFYNGASIVDTKLVQSIPTDGSRISTGFSPLTITSLEISGSGYVGTDIGLGEVAVFEPSGLGLYNTSFYDSGVHLQDRLHIATWFHYPNDVSSSSSRLNVFHNIKENCQYSGINLYSYKTKLVLDFATVLVSGNPVQYIVQNKRLSLPWDAKVLEPMHFETYGGKTNGLSPTALNEGYLAISNKDKELGRYTLKVRDAKKQVSGEFFLFKNPSYQNGIDDLFFGVNNWQFSDSLSTPNTSDGSVNSNLEITSNIKIGTTAIWTGFSYIEPRKQFFNRADKNKFDDSVGSLPRTYSEITSNESYMLDKLFAWWDMDMNDSSPYSIVSSNTPYQTINLSGQYTGSMDSQATKYYNAELSISQTPQKYLPFGGFPGIDRYGK